jgi:hypothetical protein
MILERRPPVVFPGQPWDPELTDLRFDPRLIVKATVADAGISEDGVRRTIVKRDV